jgi:murein DD-endopeptidase MepM/ murein hydrolase activator NlpD
VRGVVWSYTGGPHGAWEREGAKAALDFAPATDVTGCHDSNQWALAVGAGVITRSFNGVVALDLDGDSDENTGWVIVYLHIADLGRVSLGRRVEQGDKLGHPSCLGGMSTGTHVHLARKYNGEWIAADGPLPFVLGGWTAHAGSLPYQGTLTRAGATVTASTVGAGYSKILRTEDDP